MFPTLQVITTSTRPGRIGPAVADWFAAHARRHGAFEVQQVDLADFNLPLYDEPRHPLLQDYEHEHTRRWSRSVAAADAYVFVLPEYNYSPPPSFVNALDYVYREWNYKPAGFVSYGGVSGGLRAAQAARLQASTLKLVPIPEGVPIPMAGTLLDESALFRGNALIEKSATTMLDELAFWARGLQAMRANAEALRAAPAALDRTEQSPVDAAT